MLLFLLRYRVYLIITLIVSLKAQSPELFINEFLSSNSSINLDPDFYSFCDWIEIYNSEDTLVDITGYYITDDLSNPMKFQFPDSSMIQPNSYFIVWADDGNYYPGDYHIYPEDLDISVITCHTNFKLKKSGEEVGLFNSNGDLIDSIIFDEQITDISYGRKSDGNAEWFYFSEPTPLDSNLTVGYGDTIRTSPPQFVPIGGFYSATQTLELTSENSSATIRFTIDGSKPTVNSNIYTSPIIIDSTTVIRAQVFETGILPSLITTSTYFIDEASDLPVISIGIDSMYLWDDEIGIYTVGTNGSNLHGDWGSRPDVFGNYCQDWERPISMEYYSSEENLEFKVDAGIKIHGGTTRGFPQKSLTVHFRNKYGDNEINYQFFDDKPIEAWNSIMLRNGEWLYRETCTMFHDGMVQTLIPNEVDVDRQCYKPSIVFLNGEYWGIHNIRERTSSHFIETNHNIGEDNIDMLGCKYGNDYVIEGDMEDYNQLINFIESNDISLTENFNYVQTQVDINELLNYQILIIYARNSDWPQNNYKLWKPKSGNGKWRWIIHDMDGSFNKYPDSSFTFNMFNHAFYYTSPNTYGYWSKSFLHSLMSNSNYVNEFIQRFATHLNTIYNPERVIQIIDSLKSKLELEMPRHLARWESSDPLATVVDSMIEWEDNVEGMREFAIERPNYVRQHIIDYFDLSGSSELTVNISGPDAGRIRIHDINIQSYPDTGVYFQNIPIRIVAIPNEGYQFVNWQGNSGETSNSDSISVILIGDSTITAVFEPTDYIPIIINEINYNSASDFDTDDWVEIYNNSDSSINISDWQFKDSDDNNVFTISNNTILQDSGFIVLCKDTTVFKSLFPDVENYMGNFDFGLSGGGELIRLYDQQGQIVDFLTYDDNSPWPEEPDGNGPTLELINVNLDNALAESWRSSFIIGGSPGSTNIDPLEQTHVIINEFMACNLIHAQDDFGEYDDWIELYNPTDNSVNISGYYITDNLNNLTKWEFPQNDTLFVINPGEYLIIWADGEPFQGNRHISFSLDKEGEEIAVIGSDGETIIDQIIYGYQRADISMGRDSLNSNDLSFFMLPSMGVENGVGYQGFADAPNFLPAGGYYDQSQMVLMSYPYDSDTLHYTLDLSDPTKDDPLYISGVDIANTSVLRARTFRDNFIPSSITSHNYLINESYSLPVLAILTNPENLWNDTTGIYVNFWDEGILWERRCTNQYFTQDSLYFTLESGVRIQGGGSRYRPKKSFRLFYKNSYEQDRLLYPLFGPFEPTSFKNLVLRAGYDDDIQMSTGTLLRDPLTSEIWSRMGMLVSRGNFANLYLNDQYWGIYNIRESINEHFIRDHTGYLEFDLIRYIKSDDQLSLPSEIPYLNSDLKYGTLTEWESLNEFMCTSDFTNDSIFVEATNLIDMENYLNLQALIICSEYRSWTYGVSVYREQNPLGKWRWTLWDMDRAFTDFNWNGFTFLTDTTGDDAHNIYALRLLQNEQFKINYINRISDFLNSIFLPENVISIIDSLSAIIAPDIHNEVDKWGMTVPHWENNVDTLRLFAENRPQIVQQQLTNYFSLIGSGDILVNANNGGRVKVNTLFIHDFPWTGVYFYGVPIKLVAIPNEGYQFVNWQGNSGETSNSDSISVILIGDSTITAVFEPTDYIPIIINEINYNSASDFDTDDWVEIYNNSDSSINISDWQFKDSDDNNVFTIPNNTILQDSGFIVLCKDTTAFKSLFPDVENYLGNFDFGLSGGGELIRLYDQQGQIVDSLTYDDNSPWPEEPDGNGPTLELINVNLDNALPESWRSSFIIGGSPGSTNDAPIIRNLYINEFIASNDSCYADDYSEYDDWIELYNAGNEAINIGGLFITDDLDDPTSWQIPVTNPDQTIIQPDSFLVLWADKDTDQGVLHVDIKLSGSGEQIGIAIINFPDTVYVDSLSFGEQTSDVSYGRYPDGGENWQYYDTPTPNASNTLPENNPPVLTTLLPDVTIDEDDFGAIIIPSLEAYFHDVDEGDILTYTGSALVEGLDSLSFTTDEGSAAIGHMANDHGAKVMIIKRSELKQHSNSNIFPLQRTDKDKSGQQIIMSFNAVSSIIDIRQNRSLSRTDSTALIVYPTLNFNGDVIIAVTCTDTSSASITDTLVLTILPINDVPVLALGDTTINEDEILDIILPANDIDGDELIYNGSSDTNSVVVSVIGVTLSVSPAENWNGSAVITVVVIDENSAADSTDFTLTVTAVNDPPDDFSVIYPTVLDTFSAHVDNDTLIQFRWNKSNDVDSEIVYTLTISLEFFGNVYTDIHEDIVDTTLDISSNSLDPILNVIAQDEAVFTYYIHATDEEYTVSDTGEFVLSRDALGIDDDAGIPEVFALHQNYPNPFNPVATLCYDLPEQANVNIIIYDMLGREVKTLINSTQDAGFKSVIWNATNNYGKPVSAGIYLYQIQAGKFVQTKKMVLLK